MIIIPLLKSTHSYLNCNLKVYDPENYIRWGRRVTLNELVIYFKKTEKEPENKTKIPQGKNVQG